MNEREVKVICNNAHLDFQVQAFKGNGYSLTSAVRKLEFIFFGRPLYELTFLFDPTDEVIERWIQGFINNENYEAAAIWRDVLIDRNIKRNGDNK